MRVARGPATFTSVGAFDSEKHQMRSQGGISGGGSREAPSYEAGPPYPRCGTAQLGGLRCRLASRAGGRSAGWNGKRFRVSGARVKDGTPVQHIGICKQLSSGLRKGAKERRIRRKEKCRLTTKTTSHSRVTPLSSFENGVPFIYTQPENGQSVAPGTEHWEKKRPPTRAPVLDRANKTGHISRPLRHVPSAERWSACRLAAARRPGERRRYQSLLRTAR